MSVIESVVVSMFTLSLVFVVLAILYGMVMALSMVLRAKLNKTAVAEKISTECDKDGWNADVVHVSSGELKLKNVDEKTAAMIMAIVSDESQIPLSELCFKSIAAID